MKFREGWRGYLWQGRFASAPMDEAHLLACARYVELIPVRAGLASPAEDWPWSSARAHLAGRGDGRARPGPMLDRVGDWRGFLAEGLDVEAHAALRSAECTGRPLGSAAFVAALDRDLARPLARQKPGPKPAAAP